MTTERHTRGFWTFAYAWIRLSVLAITFVFGSGVANADPIPIISVSPSPLSVKPGNPFALNVDIIGATDLFAFQFGVSFDPRVLQASSVTEGSFLSNSGLTFFFPGIIDNALGTIDFITGTLLGPGVGVNGSGTLATLSFTAIGAVGTSSQVLLSQVVLLDSTGFPTFDPPVRFGQVRLIPEPSTYLLLGSGLAAIILLRGRRTSRRNQERVSERAAAGKAVAPCVITLVKVFCVFVALLAPPVASGFPHWTHERFARLGYPDPDLDNNGVVDNADLDLVKASFGKGHCGVWYNRADVARFISGSTIERGADCKVDLADLYFVSRAFGQAFPVAAVAFDLPASLAVGQAAECLPLVVPPDPFMGASPKITIRQVGGTGSVRISSIGFGASNVVPLDSNLYDGFYRIGGYAYGSGPFGRICEVVGVSQGIVTLELRLETAATVVATTATVRVGELSNLVGLNIRAFRPATTPFQSREIPRSELFNQPGVGIRLHDLVEVVLEGKPIPGVEYVLTRIDGSKSGRRIRVWSSPAKQSAIIDQNDSAVIDMTTGSKRVWVEAVESMSYFGVDGRVFLDLRARRLQDATSIARAAIPISTYDTIVFVFGGEFQVPADPPLEPGNHGVFQIAIRLYQAGFDVRMYDEDDVGCMGEGPAFDEARKAIFDRGVSRIALIGYSHGGGAAFNLSNRLMNSFGKSGRYGIPFAAYIDAIEICGFLGTSATPVKDSPALSQFTMNRYQRNDICIPGGAGLCGTLVFDAYNQQVPNVNHRTIDDAAIVINTVVGNAKVFLGCFGFLCP